MTYLTVDVGMHVGVGIGIGLLPQNSAIFLCCIGSLGDLLFLVFGLLLVKSALDGPAWV